MDAILLVPPVPPVPPALNLNGRDITSTLSKTKVWLWLKIECAAKWNAKSWRGKLAPARFSLTHATPLLPALTLSECSVSGGEQKESRRVRLPRSSHAPRLMPKLTSLYFW